MIYQFSKITAFIVVIVYLLLGLRAGANIEEVSDLAFGIGFAIWLGLPFWILGTVKVFRRRSPILVIILWIFSCLAVAKFFYGTFYYDEGSTAGLGVLVIPFGLFALYGVGLAVDSMIKSAGKRQ